jgi:S1-C subfamily serine protease
MSNLVHVYKKVKPAVVAIGMIAVVGEQTQMVIAGTGFCVDPRGVIITCRHVFEGFQKKYIPKFQERVDEVLSRPNELVRAELMPIKALFLFEDGNRWGLLEVMIKDVLSDREIDIAVLRANATYFRKEGEPYPSMRMGDSNTLKEGQEVAACGFPYGYELHVASASANASLSQGVVSAILPAPLVLQTEPDKCKSFQVDMTLNPGNSGGPVFRPGDGEVVGIVSSGYTPQGVPIGINFAIPINQAKVAIKKMHEVDKIEKAQVK